MQKIIWSICLAFIVLSTTVPLSAQDAASIQNLQNINVDELSDAQVEKLIERMESSGYSQQQLETMAKARGMSASQLAKLRQRIAEVKAGGGSGDGAVDSQSRSRGEEDQRDQEDLFAGFMPVDSIESGELKIFGMDFFNNRQLTFEPSLSVATPKNYRVGPGDEIIIDVWGASEQTYRLEVSPEGSIIVPSVGPIYLNGLEIERAESRIKSKLKSIYSTLGENTFAQVSLGQIRTISVNVVGEVRMPGTYSMSSFGTAFNALYLAGGPSESGSLREIQVFRGGKKLKVLDAYDFLINGEGENIMLQDQDVLLVKPYLVRVAMKGEVKRPAYYEVKPSETLGDVLNYAGGPTAKAYTKSVSLRRNLENRKTVATVKSSEFNEFTLKAGDEITIGEIKDRFDGRVQIEGAVNHPGEFELKEGMMLSDLIELADGFSPDVFIKRAVIIRQNEDYTLSTVAFAPEKVISGEFDLALQSEDVVKVQSIFDLREEFTVAIEGEVQSPDNFPYAEGMTVEDLIYLADGFKETAAKSFVEVARRIVSPRDDNRFTAELFNFPISSDLTLDEADANFVLEPFDLVVIRKSPYYQEQEVVEVEGEVLYPGKYVLNTKTERISDLIIRAGGFTEDAFPAGGTLIRETEYFDEGSAALVKKLRIQALGKGDSTTAAGSFAINREESIAIELDEIMAKPKSQADVILKAGDVISVPKELQTVRVRGEVYFSSNLIYSNSLGLKGYVSQAGGATSNAKLSKAYIVYPNGSAERTKRFLWFRNYPNVEPGSEIIVPAKPERRKMTPQEVIGIASGIGTLAIIINNLTR
ncbi:SLBB domain-containing protein [Marinoscillum furvescens]|uniref:Protein involved in polysaccharide export with SLBB domain n=1 Tax=Marinoscillum furvescens DSM 4134 TaxID=1122208 RepID=A0A3D9L834_MARFU|nr:SLBB domain-containing protein [Marinoscillum furvescens]REE01645.1 protein involved in polysaccharide export with SLBB domain [Marinoscillum furvescens DSM 4134]